MDDRVGGFMMFGPDLSTGTRIVVSVTRLDIRPLRRRAKTSPLFGSAGRYGPGVSAIWWIVREAGLSHLYPAERRYSAAATADITYCLARSVP